MEFLQNRVDSFGPLKSKRSKASSSKQPTWPHPNSFKATPRTLAEAGFYFCPESDCPDNVACFMCKKNLDGWEFDDDPFAIHYNKCRDLCAWAFVRCQRALDDEGFDFSDSTRHPTSKAMEKARLDTFSKARWPHDAVKGHGANSRAMSKAGFLCNSVDSEDDTALCLYCNLSLSGWDEDDDPYEEHVKRDKKLKTSCAFIQAFSGNLGKSTTKRTASKAAARPLSRSISKATVAARAALDDESELEDAAQSSELTALTKTSDGRSSYVRASSAAKTPGSRRSTRGTSTTGKTPGAQTFSSELEGTDDGSESGNVRRMTRQKIGRKTKSRVPVIVEEDEIVSPQGGVDAQPQPQQQPEKKKRGRPPRGAAAKSTAQSQPQNDEEDEEPGQPAPPPAKKTHVRTRSRAITKTQTEITSTSTHIRPNSTSKSKVNDEAPIVTVPAPKKKGKQRVNHVVEDEDEDLPPAKLKGKAVVSRPKLKPKYQTEASDEDTPSAVDDVSQTPTDSLRKSSLSEDAGYATAEAPGDVNRMDVDEVPVPPPLELYKKPQAPATSTAQLPPSPTLRTTPANSDVSQRPSPGVNGMWSSSGGPPPSSRASSSRPPSKLSVATAPTKDLLKVVEIDSDVDGSPERPIKLISKAPVSMQGSTSSVDVGKQFPSLPSRKKLIVEVIMPPKTSRPVSLSSNGVRIEDDALAGPPPRPPRSPARATKHTLSDPSPPVSETYHSTHTSPERDAQGDEDVEMADEVDVFPAALGSPHTYHPFLAHIPIEKMASLTEEETEMTLEQYIRREMELQYAQLKTDGERYIEGFKQKAAETRRLIGAS